jgi:hypothetical protein
MLLEITTLIAASRLAEVKKMLLMGALGNSRNSDRT